jgi:hypothetical protein
MTYNYIFLMKEKAPESSCTIITHLNIIKSLNLWPLDINTFTINTSSSFTEGDEYMQHFSTAMTIIMLYGSCLYHKIKSKPFSANRY